VWYNEEEDNTPQIILLDAFKDRIEFPELKQVALKHWKEWKPDAFIVEKKAAGAPLIQELRKMGIPVEEFTPSRGNDKNVRVNAVADLFRSGIVWAPGTRWANEVIEEVASFPVGEHDDFVDTTTQALLRFRQGNFISLDSDMKDEPSIFRRRRYAGYY
jgi:predicted phage terminase large subunit-like protein